MDALPLLSPIGKIILASIALWVCYLALLQDRASFKACRLFLLLIPVASITIGLPQITIYTPPEETIMVQQNATTATKSNPAPLLPAEHIHRAKAAMPTIESTTHNLPLSWIQIAVTTYTAISITLLLYLLIQYLMIIQIIRKGKAIIVDGIRIVTISQVKTPFSFGRTIFINNSYNSVKMKLVIEHESWHIRHRHYIDVILMELSVRLFWINPLIWIARKELRNLHEYEADQSVIQKGADLYTYQTTILEEVMSNSPLLANGFNSSFIKKRFIKMKQVSTIRRSTMRRALLIPYLLTLFCLFTFAIGETPIRYQQASPAVLSAPKDSINKEILLTQSDETPKENTQISINQIEAKTPINPPQNETKKSTEEPLRIEEPLLRIEEPLIEIQQEKPQKVQLPINIVQEVNLPICTDPNIDCDLFIPQLVSIERKYGSTILIFAIPNIPPVSKHTISSNLHIVDPERRKQPRRYIRAASLGIKLDVPFTARENPNKFLELKLYFPAIPSNCKEISLSGEPYDKSIMKWLQFENLNFEEFNKSRIQITNQKSQNENLNMIVSFLLLLASGTTGQPDSIKRYFNQYFQHSNTNTINNKYNTK